MENWVRTNIIKINILVINSLIYGRSFAVNNVIRGFWKPDPAQFIINGLRQMKVYSFLAMAAEIMKAIIVLIYVYSFNLFVLNRWAKHRLR